jgi:hypothetical protein
MPLVFVTRLTDSARKLHSGPLLDHMGSFVRGREQARVPAKSHVIASGESLGSDSSRCGRGRRIHVCSNSSDIVPAKRRLNPLEKWEWAAAPARACARGIMDLRRIDTLPD